MSHPIQDLWFDEKDVLRFKENCVVRFLLDMGPYDLNDIARENFSEDDREQFAQLTGYSLSGFAELSYVSDETYYKAEEKANYVRREKRKIPQSETALMRN